MSTPLWSAAVPGQPTYSGQINQFLIAHISELSYTGTAFATSTISSPSASDTFSTTQTKLAYRFLSPASATALTRVSIGMNAVNAGCDLLIQLCNDAGTAPGSTVYASCYVPAEWLASSLQTTAFPDHGFPLHYTLQASTNYYLVFTQVTPYAPTVNSVAISHSTATSGAYAYNASTSTWAAKSYGYLINMYSGNAGQLRLANEDADTMLKGYDFDNSTGDMTYAREWVANAATAPSNLLCRDDASPTVSIGTMTAANGTLSRSNTTALYSAYSFRISATGGTTSATISSNNTYYPVNANQTYSATAYVRPGTTVRNARININWYNSSNALISTQTGALVSEVSNAWTQITVSGMSPSNAATASVSIVFSTVSGNLASSELHYVDEVGLFINTNLIWSFPGLGISSVRSITYTSGVITAVS